VFNNRIAGNNADNFAPEGNIVGTVPAGTGLMILANDNIEVFGNDFIDNDSANVMIVSYHITGLPIDDAHYDPFPEAIHIHDNRFSRGGTAPDSEPLTALAEATGQAVPAVVWDGTVVPGRDASDILCLAGNSGDSFVNLDAPGGFAAPSFDATPHQCSMPALSTISLSLADD